MSIQESDARKIFIDGEAGTTGLQIREQFWTGATMCTLVAIAPEERKNPEAKAEIFNDVDLVILCLPDDAAKESVALADSLGDRAPRILDASTAHRVAPGWTYGFPELAAGQGEAIARRAQSRQSRLLRHRRHRHAASADRRWPDRAGPVARAQRDLAAIPAAARR